MEEFFEPEDDTLDMIEYNSTEPVIRNDLITIGRMVSIDKKRFSNLNEGQKNMVENIIRYMRGEISLPFFTVHGGGGTGKSHAIREALNGIDTSLVVAAAPSHFAKNILAAFLGKDIRVLTVASLLGKKVSYDKEGNEILVPNPIIKKGYEPIHRYKVLIIDEGSMIEDDTAQELIKIASNTNKALIVLGDYCQLPPVGQVSDAMFFDNISSELSESMRFQGPIEYITNIIRLEIIKIREGLIPSLNILNIETSRISDLNDLGSGYIFLKSMDVIITAAVKRFKMDRGTKYIRVLAYRNKTIDVINHKIRSGLYGDNPKQFEVGELLICDGGLESKPKTPRGKTHALLSNGEILTVVKSVEVMGPYDVSCIKLYFKEREDLDGVLTVSNSGKEKYNKLLEFFKKPVDGKVNWARYYSFIKEFAYFNYSYATSIHKAQGSSINHVFVIEEDIYDVKKTTTKEKLQSLYVALSRASYRLYIYNSNFKVDNSKLTKEQLLLDYDSYDRTRI